MRKTKEVKNVVLIVLLALMTGCAPMQMYSGQRLPKDQVALIESNTTAHQYGIYQAFLCIRNIDGCKRTTL